MYALFDCCTKYLETVRNFLHGVRKKSSLYANCIKIGMFGCGDDASKLVEHVVWFLVLGYLLNAITQCYMGQINGYGQPAKGMIIAILNLYHYTYSVFNYSVPNHSWLGWNLDYIKTRLLYGNFSARFRNVNVIKPFAHVLA